MNSVMAEFIESCSRLLVLICELLDIEKDKRKILLSHDLDRLENLVQKQQAAIMAVDVQEKKRDDLQTKLGFQGKSATELLDLVSNEYKVELGEVLAELREKTEQLKELNQISTNIASTELDFIDKAIGVSRTNSSVTYDASGKHGNRTTGLNFREKI